MTRQYPECAMCHGRKLTQTVVPTAAGFPVVYDERCPQCAGQGFVVTVATMERANTENCVGGFVLGALCGGALVWTVMIWMQF